MVWFEFERLFAAAQDGRVARFEAEARRIGGDVGPRFVDNDDHPDGSSDLAKLQPVGPDPLIEHPAHRVGQRGDLAQAPGHAAMRSSSNRSRSSIAADRPIPAPTPGRGRWPP